MTTKHKILKADLIAQTIAMASLIISFFISHMIYKDDFFALLIGVLAVVQVVGALTIGFLYNDKRRKKYLKVVFWMHGIGTLFLFALISLDIEALKEVGLFIFVVNYLLSPFILAFWSLANGIKGLREYEEELCNEFV